MPTNFNPNPNGTPIALARRSSSPRQLGWAHADLAGESLYIHLHDGKDRIVKLQGGRAVTGINSLNGAGARLTPCAGIRPIDFDPQVEVRQAVIELQELLAGSLACHPEQRWMLISWLLTAFFRDLDQGQAAEAALLDLCGPAQAGKTTTARLLGYLLYGTSRIVVGTDDYFAYAARHDPLLLLEQPESEPVSDTLAGLLLRMATGAGANGTDRALMAVVSPLPLQRPELIRWAYRVECHPSCQRPGFIERQVCRRLDQARGRILSGLFRLLAGEVVPGLQQRRAAILEQLRKEYPHHPQHHLDSFFALMVVILQALQGSLHAPNRANLETWNLVDSWIEHQGRIQQEALG